MQNQAKKSQATFNIRKPNEGEDNAQWKKTYLLTKKKEEEEPAEEYEEITYEVSSLFIPCVLCYVNHSSPKNMSQIAGQIRILCGSGVLGVVDYIH